MLEKEKKNKIIKWIGYLLLIISLFYYFISYYHNYKDQKKTNEIINELFPSIPMVNDQSTSLTPITNKENNSYLGYLELEDYGIKRLITDNTKSDTLDKGLVGLLKTSASLDDKEGNVIIAGHSISNVFQNLHNVKINDKIKIVTKENTYYYEIKEKKIISKNDISVFNQVHNEKILTLVTCENDENFRLIVVARLI